ncbi:MAG: PAS domain S-box protein, partial [Armatimonadota bacterium]
MSPVTSLARSILENISQSACVLGLNHEITYLNPAAERLTLWSLDDVSGRTCDAVFGDDLRAVAVASSVEAGLPPGPTVARREASLVTGSGETIKVIVSASWLGDPTAPEGIMLVLSGVDPGRGNLSSAIGLFAFPDLNPNPVLEVDPSGLVTYANPSALRLFSGLMERGKDHPFLVECETMLRALSPDGHEDLLREVRIGAEWYQQAWSLVPETGGARVYAIDITEAERSVSNVSQLSRLTRLLAMLSSVNQMIVRVTDRQQLLDEICQICVETGGFRVAAIRLLDADDQHLKVVAHHGDDGGYLGWATNQIEAVPDGSGPARRAVRTGERWVTDDVVAGPETASLREEALKRGLRSVGAFPLRLQDEVVGCLILYSATVGFTDEEELFLLDQMAGDVSFALEHIGLEERRGRAEAERSLNLERYRGLYESLPSGVIIMDRDTVIVEANQMARDVLGVQVSSVYGRDAFDPVWEAIHEDGTPFPGDTHPSSVTLRTGDSVQNVVMGLFHRSGEQTRWIVINSEPLRDRETGDVQAALVNFADITDRKKHEQWHQAILATAMDGFWLADRQGRLVEVNAAYCQMSGYTEQELLTMRVSDLEVSETATEILTRIEQLVSDGEHRFEARHRRKDGIIIDVEVSLQYRPDNDEMIVAFLRDITAHKLADTLTDMSQEVLRLLNAGGDFQESMQGVVAALKTHTGFDAVGLRLWHDEDFPYIAQEGFSEDFLLKENTLLVRAAAGDVCRDEDGNVSLECTCGLVISGKSPSSNPLFTPQGSFWTNDLPSLLDVPPNEDPRLHPRNECIHQGYASVALIPLRSGDQAVGLLQLNDKRPDRLTLELVHCLERLGSTVGVALGRQLALVETQVALERYRTFIEATDDIVFLKDQQRRIILCNRATT